MPLTDRQILDLARSIDANMSLPDLVQLAGEIDVRLDNVAPDGTVRARAETLLKTLNNERPPRDRELLDLIRRKGPGEISEEIRALADRCLQPGYSPPGDPYDAVLLGRTGFFGRADLRQNIREFANFDPYSSKVLIVRGTEPGGKTYSWEYLWHLAVIAGAEPMRLRLNDGTYTPRELIEEVGRLLNIDLSTMPKLSDDPQKTRITALLNWFQGKLISLDRPYWLVIDDLNLPTVEPPERSVAYALAKVVESKKPANLRVALLGYNEPITDSEMRSCVKDEASFFTAKVLAEHFVALSPGGQPLSPEEARGYADLLFSKCAKLNHDAMNELTASAERLGDKLRMGLRP